MFCFDFYLEVKSKLIFVHVIRNSVKYVGYKIKKEFCADLKAVYQAPTEEAALTAFETLRNGESSGFDTQATQPGATCSLGLGA